MAEPLHLQPDPGPDTEQVQLGGETLTVDRDTAHAIRNAFEGLAANYQANLEQLRAQAMQSIGTQRPMPEYQPPSPEPFGVPDPDLLFQNKQGWTDQFAQNLQHQLGGVRQESAALVQGAVQAFQQELNRRDQMQAARATHDKAMEEMLERRGLADHTRVVQAIYNEQFEKLRNLPLETALDHIGALANEEIDRIRSGERWTMGAAPTQTGVAPRPPATLRSARRAQRAAPVATPPESSGASLESPGGGLGAMGTIIRKRQAALVGGSA